MHTLELKQFVSEWDNTYKKLDKDEFLWSDIPEIEDFIPLARDEKAVRILDAGCGDGKNLSALIREPEFHCVGCDSSETALQICERTVLRRNAELVRNSRMPERRLRNFCLIESPLENMPLLDSFFDACICIDVINHNRYPYDIFKEISRVVKKNGLLYFSLFNIEDEIITDDNQRKNMKPVTGGIENREFIYQFLNSDGIQTEYYFRFLKEDEIDEFLAPTAFEIIDKRVKVWRNPPHPHFRPYEHSHRNFMITARNKK